MAKIKTIFIYGSCISRDNFNSHFNSSYKQLFEVSGLQNQTTIMSLMSPTITYNEELLSPLEGYDRGEVKKELDKKFLEDIKVNKPDILIVDFFADARFQTIKVDDSYITNNEWKITKTNFYNLLENSNIFSPSNKEYKSYMECFYKYIKLNSPKTVIILNKARGVKNYFDKNGKKCSFNSDFLNTLNKKWDMLDDLFISIAKPKILDCMNIV